MTLSFDYRTEVLFDRAVGRHNVLLRCLPASMYSQRVCSEQLVLPDAFWHNTSIDGLGNRIVVGGTLMEHSDFRYRSSGVVELSTYCIPDAVPHPMYSVQSSLTRIDDTMSVLLPPFGNDFLDNCLKVADVVNHYMTYTPAVTSVQTSAIEVFRCRRGVCQDYSHLMVALCRLAGYPARYVCGFMLGEGATHAWVEVHDGQCWYGFDPTNNNAVASGYIKLAHGRDSLDCPVSRGMYTGVAQQRTNVSVTVKII